MDYEMAIAELKTRKDAASIAILRLDERVTQHDEIIGVLVDSLATKDDIAALRGDLRERLDREQQRVRVPAAGVDDLLRVAAEDGAVGAGGEHPSVGTGPDIRGDHVPRGSAKRWRRAWRAL